ncbi:MAG: hypothetical protein ACRD1I_03955, partial [Terriglobia bacterium]
LSTIRKADQILVVEAGMIVERGTHESLLPAGGRYAELYRRQYGLESNLFLAPGEAAEEPEPPAKVSGNGGGIERESPEANPLDFLRTRDG